MRLHSVFCPGFDGTLVMLLTVARGKETTKLDSSLPFTVLNQTSKSLLRGVSLVCCSVQKLFQITYFFFLQISIIGSLEGKHSSLMRPRRTSPSAKRLPNHGQLMKTCSIFPMKLAYLKIQILHPQLTCGSLQPHLRKHLPQLKRFPSNSSEAFRSVLRSPPMARNIQTQLTSSSLLMRLEGNMASAELI